MTSLLYRRGGTVETGGGIVQPFFHETFAGTQLNPANGFTYAGPKNTSVVNFDGRNCMRFFYVAGINQQGAEQRFFLGRQLSEVWIQYDFHIPDNFALPVSPTANNKFASLWPENYSTTGETYVVVEFERNGTDTSFARMAGLGDLFPGTTIRDGDRIMNSNFISAARKGRWSDIKMHYRLASGTGQTDGVWEGWIDNELMWRSPSTWQFWSTGGLNYVAEGYLMGSAATNYLVDTSYHIADLRFYDTNPNWGL